MRQIDLNISKNMSHFNSTRRRNCFREKHDNYSSDKCFIYHHFPLEMRQYLFHCNLEFLPDRKIRMTLRMNFVFIMGE